MLSFLFYLVIVILGMFDVPDRFGYIYVLAIVAFLDEIAIFDIVAILNKFAILNIFAFLDILAFYAILETFPSL